MFNNLPYYCLYKALEEHQTTELLMTILQEQQDVR